MDSINIDSDNEYILEEIELTDDDNENSNEIIYEEVSDIEDSDEFDKSSSIDDDNVNDNFKTLLKTTGYYNNLQYNDENNDELDKKISKEYKNSNSITYEKNIVVDDFIRNFLIKSKMTRTLEMFQAEWYELKEKENSLINNNNNIQKKKKKR